MAVLAEGPSTRSSLAATFPSFDSVVGSSDSTRRRFAAGCASIASIRSRVRPCSLARRWRDGQHEQGGGPPYSVSDDSLFVAYYASAEASCHLALGWTMPAHVLDLFTEFRNATNGLSLPSGAGLLGALTYYGLDAMSAIDKGASMPSRNYCRSKRSPTSSSVARVPSSRSSRLLADDCG